MGHHPRTLGAIHKHLLLKLPTSCLMTTKGATEKAEVFSVSDHSNNGHNRAHKHLKTPSKGHQHF